MLNFLKSIVKLVFNIKMLAPIVDDYRSPYSLKTPLINGCFAGDYFILAGLELTHKFICISDKTELFASSCKEIPEITSWCIENDCIYGWVLQMYNSNGGVKYHTYGKVYTLFIATNNNDSYTLAKLTWS